MDKTIIPYVLDDAWRVFLAEVKASKRPITVDTMTPVREALTDAYVDWAAGVPALADNPELFAKRFAASVSAYAQTIDLQAFSTTAQKRKDLAEGFTLFLGAPATEAMIISPLAEVAAKLEADGDAEEADLAWRQLFALGIADPRIDAAIDRITDDALAQNIRIDIGVVGASASKTSFVTVSSAGAMRAYLEDRLGSRLTIVDIIELLDIGEPLMSLSGIRMEYTPSQENEPEIRFLASYVDGGGKPVGTIYEISLAIDERGELKPNHRHLVVNPSKRRFGFAARSVLALAIFALRHGIKHWEGRATDLGISTWPKLGAVANPEDLELAAKALAMLKANGGVPDLDLDAIDFTSLDAILALQASKAELSSIDDFYEWAYLAGNIYPEEIDALGEPYPIGYIALQVGMIGMHYETRRILDLLLGDDFPKRIARLEQRGTLEASQAASGLRAVLRQADMAETIAREIRRNLLPTPTSFSSVEVLESTPEAQEDSGDAQLPSVDPSCCEAATDTMTEIAPTTGVTSALPTGSAVFPGAR